MCRPGTQHTPWDEDRPSLVQAKIPCNFRPTGVTQMTRVARSLGGFRQPVRCCRPGTQFGRDGGVVWLTPSTPVKMGPDSRSTSEEAT